MKRRIAIGEVLNEHPLCDDYYRDRTADLQAITVSVLSSSNWGGMGLHSRGNFKGFSGVASQQKWLEVHGLEHWTEFYTDYGIDIQRRFFDHFLKGADNGWDRTPPVQSKYAPRRDSSAATRTIGRSLEHAGPLTISISTLEPCRRLSRQRTGMQYFGRERMC